MDRWIAWTCNDPGPFDKNKREMLERLTRGNAEGVSDKTARRLVKEAKAHLNALGNRCLALTRLKVGGGADQWFLHEVCTKHRKMFAAKSRKRRLPRRRSR